MKFTAIAQHGEICKQLLKVVKQLHNMEKLIKQMTTKMECIEMCKINRICLTMGSCLSIVELASRPVCVNLRNPAQTLPKPA